MDKYEEELSEKRNKSLEWYGIKTLLDFSKHGFYVIIGKRKPRNKEKKMEKINCGEYGERPVLHILKIKEIYYKDIMLGKKTFEIRKDDRAFKPGDMIIFNVIFEDGTNFYSHSSFRIKYVLRDCPEYGLEKGYCIFSLEEFK